MSGTRKRAVVVGVDGSDTSTAAALWAAGEAHARGAKLVVLYSYELYAYGAKDDAMPGSIPFEEAQLAAAGLVEAVVTAVQHARPGLEVEPRILNESAGTALLAASAESLLTVVSSHGRSARAEELIGSFAVHTAEHGLGPVAVLRDGTSGPDPAGPVMVGTDGSPVSGEAVDYAFAAAAAHQVPLHVVHCASGDHDRQLADLDGSLADRKQRFAGVEVVPAVEPGKPAVALREYAARNGASQLVVGARGVGGFAGLVLGSVSRVLLAHSEIPVVVVRPQEDAS
jgi:nucleotide-binding universal stress UspA family protein